jgi:hypothetical protein
MALTLNDVLNDNGSINLTVKYTPEVIDLVCNAYTIRNTTSNQDANIDLALRKNIAYQLMYSSGTTRSVSETNNFTFTHGNNNYETSILNLRTALTAQDPSLTLRGFARALSFDTIVDNLFTTTLTGLQAANSEQLKLTYITTFSFQHLSKPCLLKKYFRRLVNKDNVVYLTDCIDDDIKQTPEEVIKLKELSIKKRR